MKRELRFALEAQSQFSCFVGRTRSSKNQPIQFTSSKRKKKKELKPTDQLGTSVDDIHGCRRSKRLKTGTAIDNSVTYDKSEGEEHFLSREVSKGEKEGKDLVENCNVTSEKREIEVKADAHRRFTRSALKGKEENVGDMGTLTRKKLELKMSKKIGLNKMPTNMRELLETGLLEGYKVYYNFRDKGTNLQGMIKGVGILCSCSLCKGSKVIAPSKFEMHACNSYRHAIKHICLENGRSLLQVMEVCKESALETVELAVQTAINSLPVKGTSTCTNCNCSFESSSIGNAGLLCDSCTNPEQRQAGQRPATSEKAWTSNSLLKSAIITNLRTRFQKKNQQKKKRNSVVRTSPRTKFNLSQEKSKQKMVIRSKRSDPKSSKRTADCNPGNKIKEKILKRSSTSASVRRSTQRVSESTSSQMGRQLNITKKDQQLHWLIFKEGGLPDGSEVTYYARRKVAVLSGYKLGSGIFCYHCSCQVSPSQFEAHAGYASRKKPYDNIFVSNGVSLHEYAVLLKNKQGPSTSRENDDLCGVCRDGGNLVLCDGCPRSFHEECVAEPVIPDAKWFCRFCVKSSKIARRSVDALTAGRDPEIDPIEQITKRCIRIIKLPENTEVVACVLCRGYDFSKRGFTDQTVMVCDQCEKEYHVGCLRKHSIADLKALPRGEWFCCMDCRRINSVLKILLTCGPEKLPDALMGVIRKKQKDNGLDDINSFEVRWKLLSGKNVSRETRLLLTEAVNIFHERFDPIVDASTGRDFIPAMVYGKKILDQDFGRMYCAVLTINSSVVTAGILRVFGQDRAELPIVATSKSNEGKGYLQLLFTCVEKLLSALNVKKIVLPAAEETKSLWTEKFGFESIPPELLCEYRETCGSMLTFQGTSMLEKEVPQGQTTIEENGIFNLSGE